MISTFNHAQIKAISTVVPSKKKSILDEIDLYGGDEAHVKKLQELMGISSRYVTNENTTAGDLCFEAARLLMSENNLEPKDVDALIMVTQTPDYIMPATAAVIHGRLNLPKYCAAMDVNLGCSGYVYGLWLAYHLVELNSAANVLLLAGDTMSKLVNPKDKVSASLFGDAGTATWIQRTESLSPSYFSMGTDGKGEDHIKVPAGGFRQPKGEYTDIPEMDKDGNFRSPEDFYMNGSAVFAFSTIKAPSEIRKLLEETNTDVKDVDHYVFHQANKYIISNIMRSLKLPVDKTPYRVIENYGNVSMASIPLACCAALQQALLKSKKRVVFSGFGVGLSWGSCILELDHVNCTDVSFYSGMQ